MLVVTGTSSSAPGEVWEQVLAQRAKTKPGEDNILLDIDKGLLKSSGERDTHDGNKKNDEQGVAAAGE